MEAEPDPPVGGVQHAVGDEIEFVVLTLWESLESVRAFAGDDYEAAVVPPQARRVLTTFDERALHYHVAIGPMVIPEEENDCRLRDHLDDKYGQLAVIDIAAAEHEPSFYQTLTRVKRRVVR